MGAMPGKIIQCLKKTKTENPLILIDEVCILHHIHILIYLPSSFYSTALKGCRVLFSPMLSGWAGWAAEKSLSGLYLRNHKM